MTPTPKPNESESDFIARFVDDTAMQRQYPGRADRQVYACSLWRQADRERASSVSEGTTQQAPPPHKREHLHRR